MMSDGTIYALSLLVAVLDTPKYGLTLIEEPERGLHPQAIFELIVRQLKLNELYVTPAKPVFRCS